MSDPDVQRELEANEQRKEAEERAAEDDGPIIDTAERVLDPLVDPLTPDVDDDGGDEDETVLDPDDARRNDAEQRPD